MFKTLNLKSSIQIKFSGFGSIKKRFLMVKSCLEHISKLILIGKSLANYLYMYVFYVCILCMYSMYSMYVLYVCTLCMSSMYVFYLCILCMSSTYAFRIFVCKASWLSRPPGAKIHENSTCESKKVTFKKLL